MLNAILDIFNDVHPFFHISKIYFNLSYNTFLPEI